MPIRELTPGQLAGGLLSRPALYLLGAGASVPLVPMVSQLTERVLGLYLANGSFSVERPRADARSGALISRALATLDAPLDCDRQIQRELIERMSPGFVQSALWHVIATGSSVSICPDSYGVFRLMPPSLLLNYNLDGLAERWCSRSHRVATCHGRINGWFGSDEGRQFVTGVQDYGLGPWDVDQILLENETASVATIFPTNLRRWGAVVIIGYTFGRHPRGHDDSVSLLQTASLLRKESRPVVVIDPYPDPLCELLSETAKTSKVYAAPVFWNGFSTALLRTRAAGACLRDLDRIYDQVMASF